MLIFQKNIVFLENICLRDLRFPPIDVLIDLWSKFDVENDIKIDEEKMSGLEFQRLKISDILKKPLKFKGLLNKVSLCLWKMHQSTLIWSVHEVHLDLYTWIISNDSYINQHTQIGQLNILIRDFRNFIFQKWEKQTLNTNKGAWLNIPNVKTITKNILLC